MTIPWHICELFTGMRGQFEAARTYEVLKDDGILGEQAPKRLRLDDQKIGN